MSHLYVQVYIAKHHVEGYGGVFGNSYKELIPTSVSKLEL